MGVKKHCIQKWTLWSNTILFTESIIIYYHSRQMINKHSISCYSWYIYSSECEPNHKKSVHQLEYIYIYHIPYTQQTLISFKNYPHSSSFVLYTSIIIILQLVYITIDTCKSVHFIKYLIVTWYERPQKYDIYKY